MSRTIFIADDDSDVVDLLTLRCRLLGFDVVSANDAMTALKKIEEIAPDIAILDVEMPDGNGLTVCEMMSCHPELHSIPVIMLTASCQESTVRRCHELCSFYFLICPEMWSRIEPLLIEELMINPNEVNSISPTPPTQNSTEIPQSNTAGEPCDMMDTVFAILGAEGDGCFEQVQPGTAREAEQQPWVLSIEDDDDVALALRIRLQEFGMQVIRATAGTEGYRKAFLDAPTAILLDYELPGGNGDYVLRRLKESPITRDIPVIALTGRREASVERQMRNLGASEFLTKPFDWKRLQAALETYIPVSA